MEAVEAVSSQKVQYGGSWGSAFSTGSVWMQLGQCLLKRFSMEQLGQYLLRRFSMEAVGALSPFQINAMYVVWR